MFPIRFDHPTPLSKRALNTTALQTFYKHTSYSIDNEVNVCAVDTEPSYIKNVFLILKQLPALQHTQYVLGNLSKAS